MSPTFTSASVKVKHPPGICHQLPEHWLEQEEPGEHRAPLLGPGLTSVMPPRLRLQRTNKSSWWVAEKVLLTAGGVVWQSC